MVVLSAALLTRNGKVLVARQFVEITRIRLEGLLAAFPKLLSSGSREHTFIDTESVRYVYQPLESFFVLIITNKTSNIVEDLHTIQVLAKLVPDICAPLSEASIRDKQFELVFGFDELITAGGHSENINVSQIRVNMDMESHEEKLHNMILESKRAAAKDDMKRHTARIKEEQRERARLERAGMGGSGFGSQNSFGSSFSNAFKSPRSGGSSDSFMNSPRSPAATSPISYNSRPEPVVSKAAGMKLGSSSSSKGMGLGSSGKSFMDAMAAEDGLKEIPPMSAAVETVQKPEVAAAVSHDPIGAVVEEKMTVVLTRDGALEQLEVKGSMYVSVNDPSAGCCRLKLRTGGVEGVSFQTHPKVDKRIYDSESVLALRDPTKPFPTSRVAFLRWSLKTQDESMLPLNITCWPEEEGNGKMNVSVEYSLDRDMVLDNVNVVIPLGGSDAPSVANVDGQYQHNSAEGSLLWHQDQISSANNSGTLEFSIRGNNIDAFFPISVSFFSRSVYSDVQVEAVQKVEDGSPIAFGFEKLLSTDSYQIV
ncbi:Coatomer subunit delta [Phytophthora idaei]|nr:Coatomer subunit delta [Phytophthora idaei]KAG3169434.1 Coatomer subunit delta [Phytophthora idaei]KAG3254802.1 Coatomer subunit delta [Phytophthora idaei]